ncbi:CD63 antigen [Ooceraea biroi]|nr:CD63 antigen [Ooceraea biroi]
MGIIVQIGNSNYSDHMKDVTGDLTFPAVTLIVIGSIIFVIAFFGCCGAIRESHCMIVTFATLLLTILIIQVAVAIYAFVVLKNSDGIDFTSVYRTSFFEKYRPENPDDVALVDSIQKELDCCGVTSYEDFIKDLHRSVPGSCCGKPSETVCEPTLVRDKRGCAAALQDLFKSACSILGGIALGIAAIELIGIIFALCLANSIKNAERRGYSV